MDTPVITDESNSNILLQKTDSVIEDYNVIANPTSYGHSENLLNIPTQTAGFDNQLIINEEMAEQNQSNVSSESVDALIHEEISGDVMSQSQEIVEEIPLVQENLEIESISAQDGSAQEVIVTTLSEVITCDNVSVITTTCTTQSPNNIKIESEISSSLELNEGIKLEESVLDSSNSELDHSLPSFIGEVDESVSLPPAEPLILEQENIPHPSGSETVSDSTEQIVTENVTSKEIIENSVKSEIVTENAVVSEIVTDNSIDSEIVTDNSIECETVSETENVCLTENSIHNETTTQSIPVDEIVTENVSPNEMELSGAPQTEIITSTESNIQYTVLPPGENSVYQEDGTLVVEYPLDTSELGQHETVNEFPENPEGESMSNEQLEEEIVDAPSGDESMTTDAASSSSMKSSEFIQNVRREVEKTSQKPQPKQKGRKCTVGIPPHIVGSTIDKPVQDVPNGKGLKPRLGVRIPYRKLASQIVSSAELESHIAERARVKEEARYETEQTNLFTKKLTHRLAQSLSGLSRKEPLEKKVETESKKDIEAEVQSIENILAVIPANEGTTELLPTNPIEFVEQIVNEETVYSEGTSDKVSEAEVTLSSTESIENAEIIFADNANNSTNIESNSDLIAILEGDGEETSSLVNIPNVVEIVDTSENSSEIKAIEKEISLTEQKISNPATPQVKEKKFFKSRESRVVDAQKEKSKETALKSKTTITPNTKIASIKKEEKPKTNIFEPETASVSKGNVKNADSKKISTNVQEKTSDAKKTATVVEVEPQLKPAMFLKTYTRKRKSNDVSTPEPAKKPLIMPTPSNQPDPKIDCVTPIPPNAYVTKSSRVIKKKVIWDPDEAMPSVRNQSKILSKIEATTKSPPATRVAASQKQTAVKTAEKKVSETKQPEQLKITRSVEKKIGKTIQDDKEKKIVIEKTPIKKVEKPEVTKKITPKNSVAEKVATQNKVIITSSLKISAGKSPKRSFKRLSEIDKLLMDEGAVNMLNDINNSDDQKRRVSGRLGVPPADKSLNQQEPSNKAQEAKNEVAESANSDAPQPKTLRKREGVPVLKKEAVTSTAVTRKMSKDSTKSSVHSPPPSPAAFTPAEASRIIRRHSSSSFSSNEGIVDDDSQVPAEKVRKEKEGSSKKKEVPVSKMDVEEPSTDIAEEPASEQGRGKAIKKKASVTPEETPKKKPKLKQEMVANGEPSKPTEIVIKSEPGIVTGALKTDPTKAFTVIKMNKHYMINLTYSGGENYMSVQLLKDLIVTLRELERTRNCSVVSINSQGPAFCLGIDYKELVEPDEELRNKKLTEMANWVREFLKCLLNFSKVIVAGVKGDCIGFGVTMLPLFDMIVATDTASFCTPYAKIGCPPEAGFLLSIPYQSNQGLASELLYTAQRMNADEAQRRGLVTKLFWPEKFDSEFRALLSHISNLSKPALMMTKKQLRRVRCQNTEVEINANCKLLVKFWSSEECQKDFVDYHALTFDLDQ